MSSRGPTLRRRVLVLNNKPLSERPLRQWLGPDPALVLITSDAVAGLAGSAELAGFDVVETVDDYGSADFERRAIALGTAQRVTHVISAQEDDVLRAARIRRALGIGGQSPSSATAYRDKL